MASAYGIKKPASAGFLPYKGLFQRLDGRIQPALVAGSLILVNDTSVRHAVDNGHSGLVCFDSGGMIAFSYCGINLLDLGANHRPE